MNIIKKINQKQDYYNHEAATIAFLGDSITHGCFECFVNNEGNIDTIYDYKNSYSAKVREYLNLLYPRSQINIIHSGLSGDNATNGYKRLNRDVIPYHPDLCVVSFQLNDSCKGKDGLEEYLSSLSKIFDELKKNNIEIIFMNENYMCTKVSPFLNANNGVDLAKGFMNIQNDGIVKTYVDGAIKLCLEKGVKVCNIYSSWEKMANNGVDVTELLANKLNHPIRDLHKYMAIKLIETMFED